MGNLLLWVGLVLLLAVPVVLNVPYAEPVGAVLMIIGVVLLILGR